MCRTQHANALGVAMALAAFQLACGFSPLPPTSLHTPTQLFGGSSGYATSLAGKKDTVAKVKELLDVSEMIFTIPAGSMTVAQTQQLRNSLPPNTTMKVVKNKLMARAIDGTDFATAATMMSGANMWFFIGNDVSGTIQSYQTFVKDTGKKDSHPITGGVLEGNAYDAAGVETIGKLPSKDELYAQIAGAIKAVPTKVARVIKAPSVQLARAIKLATDENNKA